MKVMALRQLYGDYGFVPPFGIFHLTDEKAIKELESQGLVERIWDEKPPPPVKSPVDPIAKMIPFMPENKMMPDPPNKQDSPKPKRKRGRPRKKR